MASIFINCYGSVEVNVNVRITVKELCSTTKASIEDSHMSPNDMYVVLPPAGPCVVSAMRVRRRGRSGSMCATSVTRSSRRVTSSTRARPSTLTTSTVTLAGTGLNYTSGRNKYKVCFCNPTNFWPFRILL